MSNKVDADPRESGPSASTAGEKGSKTISSGSFLGKLSATAALTRKEALRRKLESIDLRQAEYQLGEKAYQSQVVPAELGSLISDLDEVTARIAALEQRQDDKPASSFGEKAQAAASSAASKAKSEALKLKRNGLLKDLGSKLRRQSAPDAALAGEIAAADAVQQRINALDEEIERLRKDSWTKHPLFLLIIVAIIAAAIIVGVISFGHSRRATQVTQSRQQQQAAASNAQAAQLAAMRQAQEQMIAGLHQAEQARMQSVQNMQNKYDQQARDYVEKQKQQQAARDEVERQKAEVQKRVQEQMAQKQEESRRQALGEQKGKVAQRQQQEQELRKQRAQIVATIVRTKAKIEEKEVGPTGTAVKYAVSPHALHLVAATLKGSRPMMMIDGVAGPAFDELLGVGSNQFQAPTQMTQRQGEKENASSGDAPVVFSDDGKRFAYMGRQGNEFFLIVDAKEVARGPYSPSAIACLSFTPGGKHLRYLETVATAKGDITRLVVDGKKDPPTSGLTPEYISWSCDGEHWAYFRNPPERQSELRPVPHLVVDGKENPPALLAAGYDIDTHNQPLFTGDGAHLITIRHRRDVAPSGGPVFDKIGPDTVFVDGKAVMEAPTTLFHGQNLPGKLTELSVAPQGSNFVAVVSLSNNPNRVYFNQQRLKPDVQRVDHFGWSPDGKRSAISCQTDHESYFMFLDGKQQPEYRGVHSRGELSYGSRFFPFTADSSRCVYIAHTDKQFVVANDEESDGYRSVENLTFSDEGPHFAFVATNDDNEKVMVVDGNALPPRKDVHDFAFTRDGSHYSFLSGGSQRPRGNKLIIDGAEQGVEYGADFVHYEGSTREQNRQCLISPDGKHVLYLASWPSTGEHSPTKAVCLDGKVIPCEAEKSEVAAFFTPDSKHVVWIDWGGKLSPVGGGSQYDFADVPGFSIYVDGQRDAQFECPTVHEPNSSTSTARFFRDNKNASEMGADGALTLIAQAGNVVKKLRITPAADTSLQRFAALAQEQELSAQDTAEQQPSPSN